MCAGIPVNAGLRCMVKRRRVRKETRQSHTHRAVCPDTAGSIGSQRHTKARAIHSLAWHALHPDNAVFDVQIEHAGGLCPPPSFSSCS